MAASASNDPIPARAGFGMYPFASVEWAWDELWASVARRCGWVDPHLVHVADVHATWADPEIAINHVCGWPFAAWYADTMQLVGAFDIELPGEAEVGAGYYRSVLVTPHDCSLEELIERRARAVVNSADSLSGSLSLMAAVKPFAKKWPGKLTETGAHLDSLRALTTGQADLACIDAWTLAIVGAEQPELVADLRRVGFGPVIPTPALTIRIGFAESATTALASAWVEALADVETASARQALFLRGFADHDMQVYRDTLLLS